MERLAPSRKKEQLVPDKDGNVHLRDKYIVRIHITTGQPIRVILADGRECEIPHEAKVVVDREND